MTKLLCSSLSRNKAKEYFFQTLKDGKSVSKKLLEVIDFDLGDFFVVISLKADTSRLEEFSTGGILPLNPMKKGKIRGKDYFIRERSGSETELAEYLIDLIGKKSSYIVFEELCGEKGDKFLSKFKPNIKYFQNEVYYLLDGKKCDREEIFSFVRRANAQWYYMNIITVAGIEQNQDDWTEGDVDRIARNAKLIVLGAYDIEGYVVWKKSD